MSFKLVDEGGDSPFLACDICGGRMADPWGDLVSGARGTPSAPGALVIHHAKCPTTFTLHMSVIDFFALLGIRASLGDRASEGSETRVTLRIQDGEGFQP